MHLTFRQLETFAEVVRVNLLGTYNVTRLAFDAWLQAHGGNIINISSVHEELPFPHFASYCATKGALKMLCRSHCRSCGSRSTEIMMVRISRSTGMVLPSTWAK